jgi:hypothetical protein
VFSKYIEVLKVTLSQRLMYPNSISYRRIQIWVSLKYIDITRDI